MRTEQNIYKRKDGRWEGRYFKEYDINGKIKYSSVYAKSYNEVKEKLISAKSNVLNHRIKCSKTDFKAVCYEWLESKKEKIKLSSYSKYSFAVEKYIIPNFKNYKLYELDNNSLCDLIIKNNRLSQGTLKHISTVFKSIVLFANEKYNTNIELKQYRFAKSNEEVVKTLSVSEQEKLVKNLLNRTNYIKLGILLCMYTGLRIGEICALKWCDIDLENGVLKVSKTMQRIQSANNNCKSKTQIIIQAPKSSKSIREIPLAKEILVILNKCRKMHYRDLYFLTGNINYIEPRTLQNQFKKHLKCAGIKDINFHALRHTFATIAIESGIDVKSVSEILGHSSVNMTLQKYVHISMEQKKREINKLKLF